MSDLIRVGIFGQSECGKTKLAKFLARQLCLSRKRLALVLDINGEDWGNRAVVVGDYDKFQRVVWSVKNLVVVIDEGTETIARDKDKTGLFTRIRHQQHDLFVMAHDGAVLLPVQRNQLNEVYQFQCTPEQAELWRNRFADDEMRAAPKLAQYEFLHKKSFAPCVRGKLNAQEISSVP